VAAVLAAIVMFGLGLDLTGGDFVCVWRRPRALLLGLFNQFVLLPAMTFLLCRIWPPGPSLLLGFMVIAACPGSGPSNLLTRVAGGNVALSLSLTGITSALSFITIPAAIAIASAASPSGHHLQVTLLQTTLRILVLSALPLAIGMIFRRLRPQTARWAAKLVAPFCLAAIFGVVAATFLLQRQQVVGSFAQVGIMTLALNLLTLAMSFTVATLARVDVPSRTALCLECSIHNAVLGLYVCVNLLGGGLVVMPTLAYGLIMWGTAPTFVIISRNWRVSSHAPGPRLESGGLVPHADPL
jgi:bile acid:Na+ symporter, BASS family